MWSLQLVRLSVLFQNIIIYIMGPPAVYARRSVPLPVDLAAQQAAKAAVQATQGEAAAGQSTQRNEGKLQ